MTETTIQVPAGIRYLSEWKEFFSILPNGPCILNKQLTGVGATNAFLMSSEKVIIAVPRKTLMLSKMTTFNDGRVHFFRQMNDTTSPDTLKQRKRVTFSDVRQYKQELREYLLERENPKVMTTYDSLFYVKEVIAEVGQTTSNWILVVDEQQVIFQDSAFKSMTEMKFLTQVMGFGRTVFLSATPYMKAYLEQIDLFKNLPYIKLEWPAEMQETATIINVEIKERDSVNKICHGIIETLRKGEPLRYGNAEFNTSQAVFFLNDVSKITTVVKSNHLTDDEVNILCSSDAEERLKEKGLHLGNFPKQGEPHKMFTFCTRTVFLGCDFYSPNCVTIIFATPTRETLALDISTDLPQILGRQRLSSNPYRNKAILFLKTGSAGMSEEEFKEYLERKTASTQRLIEDFSTKGPELKADLIRKYRAGIDKDRFKDDYVSVAEDVVGQPILVENTLFRLAEVRAWDIKKAGYANIQIVKYGQTQAGITPLVGTKSVNAEVLAFKELYEKVKSAREQLRLYCGFRRDNPMLDGEIDFVPDCFPMYWDALGYQGLSGLGFQESRIRQALSTPPPFDYGIVRDVRAALTKKTYSNGELKKLLQGIYAKHGYQKVALAKDIEGYLTVKQRQTTGGGRLYEIQSVYQKKISFFPHINLPNHPRTITMDHFLDMIGNGAYHINNGGKSKTLRQVVEDIRRAKSHKRQNQLKSTWLPAVTVNGVFESRHDHCLETYSSFLALDFDGFTTEDALQKAITKLKGFGYIYAIFRTPSGNGLKAIVLHDNIDPINHRDLFEQLVKAVGIRELDKSVSDLSRAQFLSWDSGLWRNPDPKPYKYQSSGKPAAMPVQPVVQPILRSPTVVVEKGREEALDSWVTRMFHDFWQIRLTDEAVVERLDRHWKEKHPEYFQEGQRHRGMLIICGTLCKAGIPECMACEYLDENFSGVGMDERKSVLDYAYSHNPFGCDRRRFK